MIELWWVEAGRYDVLPLDNRGVARNSLPRPRLVSPRTSYVLFPSVAGLPERAVLNLRRSSFSIAAHVRNNKERDEGVLISQGSRFAGFSLYVKHRRLRFHYSYLALAHYDAESDVEVPTGDVVLGYDYTHNPDGSGEGILTINGAAVGKVHIDQSVPNTFGTGGDYLYVGRDGASPVTDQYEAPFAFGPGLTSVVVEVTERPEQDAAMEDQVDAARS